MRRSIPPPGVFFPPFGQFKAPRFRRGAFGERPVFHGSSGGARPPGREERGWRGDPPCVCGTSPSGWASAGNIKAAPSPKNSAPLKSMRTHGPSFPFPQPCYPPLQKRGGMGIISLWRSSNCCAEWYGHSYRAVGCLLHPAACRIHVSNSYCNPDFPKLQGGFGKIPKKPRLFQRAGFVKQYF